MYRIQGFNAPAVEAKTRPKIMKHVGRQPFGHHVGKLLTRGDVKNTIFAEGDLLANKVNVKFNMFGAAVMHRVLGEVDGRDIVAVDDSGACGGSPELSEKLS
mgnify:CR=1 FL=1